MNNYWKTHYDSISKKFDSSLLKQVGKTINGQEISESQIALIIETVASALRLNASDSIIDLCCGNGLLTRRLAPLVKEIVGIDFTAHLIDTAKKYNSFDNIEYINLDVLCLDYSYFKGLKKILMYEALQHFSTEQLAVLLDELSSLGGGSLVFLGSIPNKGRLRAYYDTDDKFEFYMKCESEGRPHMGHWWMMGEIEQLASKYGFNSTLLPQDTNLYTAHYRFNVLLEKCR
jgi:cyclopropane fatty-acyl-phospholipid synthase-like methyltransferase